MMTKHAARILRGLVLLVAGLVVLHSAHAQDAQPYNVVFIVSDDLRVEAQAYDEEDIVQTPNLDRLAEAGMRFEHAYTQFPLCNPSRTSFLTGRYPTTTGVAGNLTWYGEEHPDYVTLPRFFKEHGYATLRSGKLFHADLDDTEAWTEGGEARNIDEGQRELRGNGEERRRHSDRFVVLEGDGSSYSDYQHATRAIEYMEKYQDEPFFLAVGFSEPHSPSTAPQQYYDLYDLDDIPLPPDFASSPAPPPGFPELSIRRRNADLFIGREASPEEARQMIRGYFAATSFMDAQVGRILNALDRLDLRNRTIVVFTSDHGYHLGEKGKWSKAYSLFEINLRVPLLIDVPGMERGSTEPPVELIDLYPTLAALTDLPTPEGLEGHNLMPLLRDPEATWDKPAFSVVVFKGKLGRSVRADRWHYVEWDEGRAGAMLFDVDADPYEMTNLVDEPAHASTVQRMKELLEQLPPSTIKIAEN